MSYTGRRITVLDIHQAVETGRPVGALVQLFAEQYAADLVTAAPSLASLRDALEFVGQAHAEAQTQDFGDDDCDVCLAARARDARLEGVRG